MANIKSAIKRIRVTAKKRANNQAATSRVRTYVKKVEEAIETGDVTAASEAFRSAQPEIQRSKMHKNTAARTLSRLSGRIATLNGKGKAPAATATATPVKTKTATKTTAKKTAKKA